MAPTSFQCDMKWDCDVCLENGCKFFQRTVTQYCVKDIGILSGEGYLVDNPDTPCPPPLPKLENDDTIEGIIMAIVFLCVIVGMIGFALVGKKVNLVLFSLDLLASSTTYYMTLTARRVAQVGNAATDFSRALRRFQRVYRRARSNSSLASSSSRMTGQRRRTPRTTNVRSDDPGKNPSGNELNPPGNITGVTFLTDDSRISTSTRQSSSESSISSAATVVSLTSTPSTKSLPPVPARMKQDLQEERLESASGSSIPPSLPSSSELSNSAPVIPLNRTNPRRSSRNKGKRPNYRNPKK